MRLYIFNMKYLIACLGNIGAEYEKTRHNTGFMVADRLAKDLEATFTTSRLAQVAEMKYRGRTLVVIKPTTYMNLSGKAVKYWLDQEKIPYLKQGSLGAAMAVLTGLSLEVYSLYVPFAQYEKAREITEPIFSEGEAGETEEDCGEEETERESEDD